MTSPNENVPLSKKLFTPGPLGVSPAVRAALGRDVGSRDPEFIQIVQSVQEKIVEIAGLPELTHCCVLMPGSGTFSVEATLQTTSDRNKKVLILACGAYGMRMGEICQKAKIPYDLIPFLEDKSVGLDERVERCLATGEYGSLAVVHCETTSGLLNPMEDIGERIKSKHPNVFYIVDAMSSFGGVVANYENVDFLVSSANKCLQGVPGFAFVICKKESLLQCKDRSMSLSLDLYDQWMGFERNGQFRFTPPTHCILGFKKAIEELEEEGGVIGRSTRYKQNNRILKVGMEKLGFDRFIEDNLDGYIITSFKYPTHPNFHFEEFYERLSEKGQLIYPGKLTNADCFRIGNIGHLFPSDMQILLECIQDILKEMKIQES